MQHSLCTWARGSPTQGGVPATILPTGRGKEQGFEGHGGIAWATTAQMPHGHVDKPMGMNQTNR